MNTKKATEKEKRVGKGQRIKEKVYNVSGQRWQVLHKETGRIVGMGEPKYYWSWEEMHAKLRLGVQSNIWLPHPRGQKMNHQGRDSVLIEILIRGNIHE